MRRNRLTQMAWPLVVASALAAGPALGQECSNADFKGRYGVQASVALVGAATEAKDNWVAGVAVADGAGVITEWKDTFVVVPPGGAERLVIERDAVAAAAEAGERVTYSVSPDCRIAIRAPLGDFVIETRGVLVNGGREVLDVQTEPPNSMGGGHWIAMGEAGKEDFASIQEQLNAMKALLDRIAVRNGLRP